MVFTFDSLLKLTSFEVVEIDLLEAGLKTEWEEIKVPEIDWKGVRRSYWNVDHYRLPTCYFT